MRCPICKRATVWQGNPYRPFSSERSKLLDLDNWFSGRYRISTPLESKDQTEETQPVSGRVKEGRG